MYNILYGRLISLNSLNFDIDNCFYDEKFMSCKDRNGLGREGCGRVAVFQWTGITYCYTIELGFGVGKKINYLAPKMNIKKGTID